MSTTHTPGPWAAWPAKSASCRHPAIMADVGQVASATWQGSERATNANARLIASAPALLEALERIANGQEMTGNFTHVETVLRYQQIAGAAIAKATGQEGGAA
jgi:hypothetical protein